MPPPRVFAVEGEVGDEQQIERLVTAPDAAAIDRILLAEPALLGVDPQALRATSVGGSAGRAAAAERVEHFNAILTRDPQSYPAGPGPIERLWARYRAGELTLGVAETLAAEHEVTRALHPLYLRWLAGECVERERHGDWQQAFELHCLIRASARRFEPLARAERWVRADLAEYEIRLASVLLLRRADLALYRSAIDGGTAIVAEAHAAGDADVEGRLLHYMGLLISNVYLQFPNDASYLEALAQGIEYLRRASALRSGADRGRSLALLAPLLARHEALVAREAHDGEGTAQTVRIARDALASIDAADDLHDRVYLLELLAQQGESITLRDLEPALDLDADAWYARHGVSAFTVLASLMYLVAPLDVTRALEVARTAQQLTERLPYEPSFDDVFRSQARLLARQAAADPAVATLIAQAAEPARDIAAALKALARDLSGEPTKLATALVALAWQAARSDAPARALRVMPEVRRASPELAQRFATALGILEGDIWRAVAGTLVRREEWPDALAAMSAAIVRYLRAGAHSSAEALLEPIQAMVGLTANPMEAIHAIAPVALELELKLGDKAAAHIQEIVRRALARMAGVPMHSDDYLLALHLSKGLRFATALGHAAGLALDPEATALLERIGAAEREIQHEVPVPEPVLTDRDFDPRVFSFYIDALSLWGQTELVARPADPADAEQPREPAPIDPEGQAFAEALKDLNRRLLTLTSNSSEGEREAGTTPLQRLTNLQRRFDWSLEATAARSALEQPAALTGEELKGLLDERSVLLDLYIGRSNDDPVSVALYSMLATSAAFDANVQKLRFSEGWINLFSSAQELRTNALALSVQQARMGVIRATAGSRIVDRDAAAGFERDLQDYLGRIADALAALREQGKDHLCIVPHGPLHFHPLHLLGPVGKALADDWIVTYLPSLQCLRRARHPAPRRAQRLMALGLGFADGKPHDLVPLPSSIAELNAVASAFGVAPVMDAAATEEAFIGALRDHRYVHLSTHGRQNADAPAFQLVYLSPSARSDGRLYVHELAGVDMRGLEILSLSACETALGRFDAGDNLRGLPARCFISGAQTVISTLWEANAGASERFFATFYQRLFAGDGKLEAFATAQRATRKVYPKYADWAAFCFMGDWQQSTEP